jgi:hypothetical protein
MQTQKPCIGYIKNNIDTLLGIPDNSRKSLHTILTVEGLFLLL